MRLFSLLFSAFVLSTATVDAQIITTISGSGTNQSGFAGDGGLAVFGRFRNPGGMVMNDSGDLFIADRQNNRIRKIDRYGYLSTIAGKGIAGRSGDGGPATAAKLWLPSGITIDKKGNLYFAERSNHVIRKISADGIISTVAGNGTTGMQGDNGAATMAQLSYPYSVAIDEIGNMYIADDGNHKIRKVDTTGIISTFAGTGVKGPGINDVQATASCLNNPKGVAYDGKGNLIVVSGHGVRKINLSTGMISQLAGGEYGGLGGDGGLASHSMFNAPTQVTVDKYGSIFVSDFNNHRVRMIDTLGKINTVAGRSSPQTDGDGGSADAAGVNQPDGICADSKGNLYIADGDNNIRFVYMGDINGVPMHVFPNPCKQKTTVILESSYEELATMYILDMAGHTAKTIVAPTNREIQITIDVAGVYMLQASSKHKTWQGRIVSLHD
jgi:sugar lactone lactonase YvrE